MSRVVVLVSGYVQGVFRAPLQGPAPSLRGVGGSGVLSGRVEVVLEGPDDAVADAVAELDSPGAPGSVSRVESRAEPEQGSKGFTVA